MEVGSTKRQDAAGVSKKEGSEPTRERPKATGPAGASFGMVLRQGASKKGVGLPAAKAGPGQLAARTRREPMIDRDGEKKRPAEEAVPARPPMIERDESGETKDAKERRGSTAVGGSDADLLDPSMRHLAQLAPPTASAPHAAREATHETVLRARSLEELLPALVRRIAWAGDRHRGTVRLELGAGVHAGTTVVVHADHGKVRVEIGGGPDVERLRERLDARLRGHGLDVESVT